MQKLQNVFIQQYRAYLNDESNSDKCHLAKMCDKGVYNMSHYLSNVKSPQIRSIIAKYRLYVNNTLDSKYRSFRYKNTTSNLCRFCNVRQSVKHIQKSRKEEGYFLKTIKSIQVTLSS